MDHLRTVLNERGYGSEDTQIVTRTGPFEDHLEEILQSIRTRQPRSGRAIILLDQTGFSQVDLGLISRIFRTLSSAEVILTFAADALVNHLSMRPQTVAAVSPLQLSESKLADLIQARDGAGGRALIQRTLREHIRALTGAKFDTPFFIRPRESRRALWFLHLSKHPTARDVMIQQHWNIQNIFEHYGSGGFGMMGWDALRDSNNLSLFRFEELDAQNIREELLDVLPKEIFNMVSDAAVSVRRLRGKFANKTAARFSDLDQILVKLCNEREFNILSRDGKVRSHSLRRIRPDDRIALPRSRLLPGLSRL